MAIVAYDPEVVPGAYGGTNNLTGQPGTRKLSLATDFMVQGEGAHGGVVKFGPVIIPSLEFGR